MYNKIIAVLLIASFAFFCVPSLAEWQWWQNANGNYYTRVQDGDCESGVTVYYFSDHRGKGWRVAFDKKRWINLNWPDPNEVKEEAEKRFFTDYCGTENYQPDCPQGSVPASQRNGCQRK